MASTSNFQAAHSSPSSSHLISPSEYEVFISFRGADTRHTFTDHLYYALDDKGIATFKDDEELESGKPISRELLNAIEASRVAVVLLSENYASSSWCLEELAKVVECLKAGRMRVFPIFYHVDPSDVRHQKGSFAVAFEKHEKRSKEDTQNVQRWRDALTYIANLAGHHLKDGSEAKLIRELVEDIFRHLKDSQIIVGSAYEQSLVGINSRFQELSLFMDMESNDVQIIGISGMSGVGKTTLALVAFGRIRHKFDASSFLRDVKSCDMSDLLDQLLWDMKLKTETPKWTELEAINQLSSRLHEKKVLIVFDDVDIMKFKKLAWKHNWFGLGSRIILTTEDESILKSCGAKDNIYKVKKLNSTEAQQLFCQNAFGEIHCEKDLEDICNEVVGYVEGHPLSLKVLGLYFSTKEKHLWKDMLEELRENPNNIIPKTLKMSYEELSNPLKELFLYIACFFCGNKKEHIVDLLVGSHKIRADHIDDLIKKSLITEVGGKLWMHQSLVEMGRQIVNQCHEMPDRMRNWDDVSKALEKNTEMNSIKGIMLNLSPPQEVTLRAEAFLKMTELRLLKICDVQLPQGLSYIPNGLRLLEWHHYPMQSMPRTFQPKKLVELIMPHSCIKKLTHGLCNLDKLKLINLSYSQNLMETPDVSGLPNLEKLICQGCKNLNVVHTSIGVHEKLILLNLKNCKRLKRLPLKMNLGCLKTFILSGCSQLETFPEIGPNMESLLRLYLDGTAIKELPPSIEHFSRIKLLNFQDCKILPRCNVELPKSWCSLRLSSISSSIVSIAHIFSISCFLDVSYPELQHNFLINDLSRLSSLVTLNLSDCNLEDGALLDGIKCLSSLSSLDLSRNNFTSLPNCLSQLSQLKDLYLRSCTRLQSLPDLPLGIEIVEVPHCNSLKDYSNKIKEWTSDGAGYTLIIGQILHHRRTVIKSRLSAFSRIAQKGFRRFLLRVKKKYYRCAAIFCLSSGIQKWFNHPNPGSSVPIKLPPGLYNDRSWRGIALCAVIVNHKNFNESSSNKIICRLDNNGGVLNSPIVFSVTTGCRHLPSFQLLLYIPDEEFRAQLDEHNCISPSVTTNNPDLEAKQCVASLIYKEDMVDFGRIYRQLCRDLESKCHKKYHQSLVDQRKGPSKSRSCSDTRAETASPSCTNIRVNIIGPRASCSNTRAKREFKSLLSQLYQVKYAQNYRYDYIFPWTAIPRWFHPLNYSPKMNIQLDPNYESMIGFVVCAYRIGCKQLADSSQDSKICLSFFRFSASDESPVTRHMTIPLSRDIFVGSSRLVVGYIPLLIFPLNPCSEIQVSFYSGNDTMRVSMCGARVVRKQDIGEFVNMLVDLTCGGPVACHEYHYQNLLNQVAMLQDYKHGEDFISSFSPERMIGPSTENVVEDWASPKAFPKQAAAKHISTNSSASIYLGVEFGNGQHGSTKPISILESRFKTYLEDIYKTGTVFSHCFPQRDIPPWFCSKGEVPSSEFRVPPYLLFRPDWRGISICVSFSFDKHPTAILNNLNAKVFHNFTCFMETDIGWREIVSHRISEDEVLISLYSRSFIWVLFIPSGEHLLRWTRRTEVKFWFAIGSADITIKACGFRHVDERIMKDFSHTMVQLITSYVGCSNELRMSCDKESAIYNKLPIFPIEIDVADNSKEDIYPNRMPSTQDFDPSSTYSRCFRPSKATQKWFSHQNSGHSVTIGIPPNLCADNDWLGLTLYSCFSEERDQLSIFERIASENEHHLSCRVRTRGNVSFGSYYEVSKSGSSQEGQFVWILYLTGDRFREMMGGCNHIEASFASDWSGVTVQNCGVCLLYQHNHLQFGHKLRHCNALNVEHQEDHHQFLAYQEKVMEQNPDYAIHVEPTLMKEDSECFFLGEDIRAEIKRCKKDLMEFDGCSVLNFCLPPRKIFSWFNHCSGGPSMTIDVPTRFFDDTDWMGLSLFTYFSVHECQGAMLEKPNSTTSHQLICCLESNVAGLEPTRHVHVTNKQESRWICTEDEFLWLSYIPRGSLPEWLNQSTVLEVSFASDGPSLTVTRSGLRFFHLHDQEELELIICKCLWAILTPYWLHQFRAQADDNIGPEGASHTDQCSQNEISSRPFHRGESSEMKNQQNQSELPEFDQYRGFYRYFPPSEILEWFSHQSDKPILTIFLPPNLHKDRTCMGLAICVSFLVLEPLTIIDNQLDLKFCCSFRCRLESKEQLFRCQSKKAALELSREGGFNLLQYIPCGWFSNWGYQSSRIEVSVEVYSRCITMRTCGYRLLYHSDEIEWKEMMRDTEASFSENRDVAHQVKKPTKPTHEDKAKADTTGVCDEVSPPKRVRGSPNPKPKFKGKCVIK